MLIVFVEPWQFYKIYIQHKFSKITCLSSGDPKINSFTEILTSTFFSITILCDRRKYTYMLESKSDIVTIKEVYVVHLVQTSLAKDQRGCEVCVADGLNFWAKVKVLLAYVKTSKSLILSNN